MEYTVIDSGSMGRSSRTYTGFTNINRSKLMVGSMMVVAWFDGSPELWMVDGMTGVEALRQYYREDWGDREIPFDIWTILATDRPLGVKEQF